MAEVTIEDLAKYLEFNPNQPLDEVKKELDSKFVRADVAVIQEKHPELYSSILGKANHAMLSKVKHLADKVGLEVTWSDFKDKQTVDVMDEINTQIVERVGGYSSELDNLKGELETAKKTGASAKDVEALQKQVEEWQTKYNDTKGLLETTTQTFETYKSEVAGKEKEFKIKTYKDQQLGQVKLAAKSEYERKGFLTELESKYQLDLEGEEVVVRGKDGKRLANPDKAGAFLSFAEVAQLEAKEAGLLDENPHNGKPAGSPKPPAIPTSQKEEGGNKIRSPYFRER